MLIRPATEADADGCARVMARAMAASPDYGCPKEEEILEHWRVRVSGYLAGTYHPGFAKEERTGFVAEESGEIIAFVAGHRTMRFSCDGEVQWAFVLPEWQRRGIGSSLLSNLRQWFAKHGMKKVCVNASAEMKTRAFYLKHGAVPMSEHWCVWEDVTAKR